MWKCSKCLEEVGDEFDVCWNCQTGKDGSQPEGYFRSTESAESKTVVKTSKVRLGNLWLGFRVGTNKAAPLVSEGELRILDEGTVELSARYDRPGNGWRAFVAWLVTIILALIFAQYAPGLPILLLWYVIILFMRRQSVTLNLKKAEAVVVDAANRRLGFLTDFLGAKHWVAFEIKENFDDVVQNIRAMVTAPATEGKITRRLRLAMIAFFIVSAFLSVIIFGAIKASLGLGR